VRWVVKLKNLYLAHQGYTGHQARATRYATREAARADAISPERVVRLVRRKRSDGETCTACHGTGRVPRRRT
jgi:hypothetical protein